MKEGWKQIKLGEVCKINKKNINKDFKYNDITYLDISSVGSGDAQFDNVVSIEEAPSRAKRIPIKEDSIIATVRPGNKTYCYLNNFPENTVVSTGFAVLTPINDKIDSRYLYYIISENSFTSYLVSVEKGANYPAVSAKDIFEAKVTIPPLKTQRKIASILSAYDDLIENNLKRIKLLEERAQQTYEEWFVRFKFPGYEDTEFDEVSGLPVGWKNKDLNYLCDKITDGTHATPKQVDEGYKLITGKHIGKGFVNFESAYLISEEDHFSIRKRSGLDKGDILFSNIGTLGNIAVVSEDFEYSCKNVIIFKKKDFFQNYLYCYLTNTNTKNKLDNQSSGVAQKFYSLGFIRNFKDNFPNEELVQSFDKVVSPLFQLKYNLFNQNQRLKEARDIFLPRLMSGMIDVDGLEMEESLGLVAEEQVKYNKV